MTKTSLHAQGWDPWLLEYLAASGARWIKFVNWFPEVPARIIGRVHVPEEESNVMVSKGEVGAVEFYNRVRPEMDKNRHVTIWEGPNEVSIWQAWVLQGFYDFYQKLIELYHADGFPIMAGQINTGWPYLPEDDGGGQSAVVG
nr:hypothetical protein [Anaerolineae bacterium]